VIGGTTLLTPYMLVQFDEAQTRLSDTCTHPRPSTGFGFIDMDSVRRRNNLGSSGPNSVRQLIAGRRLNGVRAWQSEPSPNFQSHPRPIYFHRGGDFANPVAFQESFCGRPPSLRIKSPGVGSGALGAPALNQGRLNPEPRAPVSVWAPSAPGRPVPVGARRPRQSMGLSASRARGTLTVMSPFWRSSR
jgi:hypothetical protein